MEVPEVRFKYKNPGFYFLKMINEIRDFFLYNKKFRWNLLVHKKIL